MRLPESIYDVAPVLSELGLVLGSPGVVFPANIVHSALPSGLVSVCISPPYLPPNADFVAVAQIPIYVGAANAPIPFAVTPVASRPRSPYPFQSWALVDATTSTLCASVLLPMIGIIMNTSRYEVSPFVPRSVEGGAPLEGVQRIGFYLLTDYSLPFELLSVVLSVAPVGATFLARRD
uniref:NAD(P)H-quinone oxidoreductase subunit 6, chloroplastic n=1 Tax=Selaginella remotifolia TaxID=137170 RepID=A0A482CGM2_SELRE|nr:NADH-plastoquinone oxidoreductase subunit 6 [Selaginella remotifolia]QBL76300.1 NADH-plastoquinone oxidoreductase subunit 6 [Selaginella remotifolia]